MKKIITTLFVLIASILTFSFTVDTKEETTYKSIQELSSDARYIGLLQDELQLVNRVKNLEALASYDAKENLSNTDINNISTLLGYRNKAGYERALQSKAAVIKALNKDYNLSKYSKGQLTQIGITTINSPAFKASAPIIIDGGPVGDDTSECERLCENSRIACIAAAAAAASAGHIACIAADTTVILGIACHAAVAATQAAVSHQCNTTAAKCVHDCRK